MKTHDADRIRRKAEISQDERTAARDDAARFVEEEVVDEGRWPELSLTDIANESAARELDYLPDDGWSRQHIANTIEAYFEPVFDDGNGDTAEGIAESEASIPVPEDLDDRDVAAYVRGYLRAQKRYQ